MTCPAAHGAALFFDLVTLLGLVLLGRRLRPGREGRELGMALGFAWAAFPYAFFSLESNSNDSIVAMFTVLAMLAPDARARPPPAVRRQAAALAVGLGAAAKFAPLALAPLFARRLRRRTGRRGGGACRSSIFVLASVAVIVVAFAAVHPRRRAAGAV